MDQVGRRPAELPEPWSEVGARPGLADHREPDRHDLFGQPE
jgi:hypothetical protein